MPNAFLSYSRDDAPFAAELEKRLQSAGWSVWRDVHSLRAGDRWPRKVGEGVTACDVFVLIWSAHAAGSDFVEQEWTIAVATKRQICIVALDGQSLPATLSPYQAHRTSEPDSAVEWLTGSLAAPDTSVGQLTAALKAVYILLPVLMVLAAAIWYNQIVKRSPPSQRTPGYVASQKPQPFGGFVQDEQGRPLEGVKVTAPNFGVTAVTDRFGRFSLQLPISADTNFRLVAEKAGFVTLTADPPAGDTSFNCVLRKNT